MLSIIKRWRIVKSIDSGGPTPQSIAKALEKSPELRAYADSMMRVHDGLSSNDEAEVRTDLASRFLNEIEQDPLSDASDSNSNSLSLWPEPIRFVRPLGLAAAVVLLSGISVVTIRPWAAPPAIEVTGEFSSLISFFQPLDEDSIAQWFDPSLQDEMNAVRRDAQGLAQGTLGRIPGANLVGGNQGEEPR